MAGPDYIDGTNTTSRRRSRRPRRRRSPFGEWVAGASRWILGLVVVSLIGVLIGLFNMYRAYAQVRENINEVVNIQLPEGSQATRIYARDYDPKTGHGTLLGEVYEHKRHNVDYDDLPPQLIACVLSTEDKLFYEHSGVDFTGTARAVLVGLRRGGDFRGTSTITQQLARNVFLPFIKSERTLNRKVQEFVLASALEKRFEKHEILQSYLNHVYFGHQAYGARTAASTYFGKPLNKLSLSECAMLAGLPQLPHKNDPYINPEGAEARRQTVLKLLKNRINSDFFATLKAHDPEKFKDLKITAEQIDEALAEKPKLKKEGKPKLYQAEYFVEYVRSHVLAGKYGGESIISRQGLVVVTTIDPVIQKWAEQTLAAEIDKVRKSKNVSQGAVIVLEAKTGEVLACVGGYKWGSPNKDGKPDQLNRAMTGGRQTGSSFKPFTYATAYEQGFPSGLVLYDGPYAPETKKSGKPWPKNSDHKYTGLKPMHWCLQQSRNAAAVDLIANCTGIEAVIDTAKKMGIEGNLPPVPALTLGVANSTPVEMAEAYATFPNMGLHIDHTVIKKVFNQDGVLVEANDNPLTIGNRSNMALSPDTGWKMVNNMQRAVNAGTGQSARVSGVEIGGKTGTCDDFGDAWFCGYSPELVCVVWVGNDNFQNKMSRMFGGNTPAATFAGIMKKIYGGGAITRYKQTKFVKPANVTWAGLGRDGRVALNGVRDPVAEAKKKADAEAAAAAAEDADGNGADDQDESNDDSGFYDQWSPPSDGNVFF